MPWPSSLRDAREPARDKSFNGQQDDARGQQVPPHGLTSLLSPGARGCAAAVAALPVPWVTAAVSSAGSKRVRSDSSADTFTATATPSPAFSPPVRTS